MNGPRRDTAVEKYREVAPTYDRRSRFYARFGGAAISRLRLRRGQRVLDVACGTGANLAELLGHVGPEGEVLGVDLSPDMLAVARRRVEANGWSNVTLVQGAIEDAELPADLDAALFSLTHDVLQSERAVENVVAHLRQEAAVAAFGVKAARGWKAPLNVIVRRIAGRYLTTFEGLDRPWGLLERHLGDLYVEEVLAGCAYILSGHVRHPAMRD